MNRLLAFSMMLFIPVAAFAEDAKNLLKPISKAESWRFEEHEGAKGSLKIDDDAAVFNATKLTGTNWHLQAFQVDLDLKEGKEYTLKLKLAASQSRSVLLVATIDTEDWHEIGLHEDLSVGKEVKTFDFTFRASGVVAKKNRIGFVLGEETGDLIVKEMSAHREGGQEIADRTGDNRGNRDLPFEPLFSPFAPVPSSVLQTVSGRCLLLERVGSGDEIGMTGVARRQQAFLRPDQCLIAPRFQDVGVRAGQGVFPARLAVANAIFDEQQNIGVGIHREGKGRPLHYQAAAGPGIAAAAS